MGDQIFTSWNQVVNWVTQVDELPAPGRLHKPGAG